MAANFCKNVTEWLQLFFLGRISGFFFSGNEALNDRNDVNFRSVRLATGASPIASNATVWPLNNVIQQPDNAYVPPLLWEPTAMPVPQMPLDLIR